MARCRAACAALLLPLLITLLAAAPAAGQAASSPVLRWGGDAEGGAPFVEADPANPSILRGFDVEIAALIAQGLGRTPQFVQVAWTSIDASVARGDFDIGLSGVEDTPARRARLAVTRPVLRVPRSADGPRGRRGPVPRRSPTSAGRRVGTLGGTLAYEMLLAAAARRTASSRSPTTTTCTRTRDLADGRLDAVLLDHVIAARARAPHAGPRHPAAAGRRGYYVGVLAPWNAAAARPDRRASCARRCATAASRGSSAGGASGTTEQAAFLAAAGARGRPLDRAAERGRVAPHRR